MYIPAELVVVTGCESGLGKLNEGEGLIGFSYALKAAGAKGMVLALWTIPLPSSRSLFNLFWEEIARTSGNDKVDALRKVKLSLITSKDYSNPFYWAPFAMYTDN